MAYMTGEGWVASLLCSLSNEQMNMVFCLLLLLQ
jgi:hypothetical protein